MENVQKDRVPGTGTPSQNLINSKLVSNLLSSISGHTRQNPMPRKDLLVFAPEDTRDPDRYVRDLIHKLREKGTPICSNYNEGGYWIATDWDDFERFYNQYTAGARKIFKASKAMRKRMKELQSDIDYPNKF